MLTQNKAITLQEYCDAFTGICADTAITINNATLSAYVGIDTDENGLPISYNQCIKRSDDNDLTSIIYYNNSPANVWDIEGTFYSDKFTPSHQSSSTNKILVHDGKDFKLPTTLFQIRKIHPEVNISYDVNNPTTVIFSYTVECMNDMGEIYEEEIASWNYNIPYADTSSTSLTSNYNCYVVPLPLSDKVYKAYIHISYKSQINGMATNPYFYEEPRPDTMISINLGGVESAMLNSQTAIHYSSPYIPQDQYLLEKQCQINLNLYSYLTEKIFYLNQNLPYTNDKMGRTVYYDNYAEFWDYGLSTDYICYYHISESGEMKINWNNFRNYVRYIIVKAHLYNDETIKDDDERCDFHILYQINTSTIEIEKSYVVFNLQDYVTIENDTNSPIAFTTPLVIDEGFTSPNNQVSSTNTYGYPMEISGRENLFLSKMYFNSSNYYLYAEINDQTRSPRATIDANGFINPQDILDYGPFTTLYDLLHETQYVAGGDLNIMLYSSI